MYGCCTTEQTFLEYTGVQFTAAAEVRGAFTRWTGKHLPELVLTKLRLPRAPAACRSRRRVVLHVRGGLRRVTVTQDGRRLRVRGRRAVIDLRGRDRRTVVVTVTGVDGRGRVTRASHRYHPCRG
jgi:CheY-like chemotaxis protein